jgi:hypothetical protein
MTPQKDRKISISIMEIWRIYGGQKKETSIEINLISLGKMVVMVVQ